MTTIESLTLTQDRIDLDSETSRMTWYGWSAGDGTSWGTSPVNHAAGRGPDYRCEVVLPAIMAGDSGEIRADIAAALRRHAAKLGL